MFTRAPPLAVRDLEARVIAVQRSQPVTLRNFQQARIRAS
jgi:hypothetical protein